MSVSYGRNVIGGLGEELQVLAGAQADARWKSAGATIDWSTVAALGSDNSVGSIDDTFYHAKAGQKVLRYGQIIVEITSVVNGSTVGCYGPYDPAATDGRQTLVFGHAFLLNKTIFEYSPLGFTTRDTAHEGVLRGGVIWLERVIQSGVATHTLAVGPTLAEFRAALPGFSWAY